MLPHISINVLALCESQNDKARIAARPLEDILLYDGPEGGGKAELGFGQLDGLGRKVEAAAEDESFDHAAEGGLVGDVVFCCWVAGGEGCYGGLGGFLVAGALEESLGDELAAGGGLGEAFGPLADELEERL